MVVHFGLHHFLDGAAEQVFERLLNILRCLDVILFEQLSDDLTLSFCHLDFVDGFLFFSCHCKGPPMI
jgi:hypothetical protein